MELTLGIATATAAASSAPFLKQGCKSIIRLVDSHYPVTDAPAAIYKSSERCVVTEQKRALKRLGIGRASDGWKSISSEDGKLRASDQVIPKGRPNNWNHVKRDLVKYLNCAEQNLPAQKFPCRSKGAFDLDKSGDPLSPTKNIVDYPAPGCISVSVHGLSPVDSKTGELRDYRKDTPFWNGTNRSKTQPFDEGLRSTEQVVEKLKLDPAEDAPIFLNSCNSGTESQGYTPAADMAKQTGRYVIAPVNTRIQGMVRGSRLADKGGEWRVFHPDGTTELLFRAKPK